MDEFERIRTGLEQQEGRESMEAIGESMARGIIRFRMTLIEAEFDREEARDLTRTFAQQMEMGFFMPTPSFNMGIGPDSED